MSQPRGGPRPRSPVIGCRNKPPPPSPGKGGGPVIGSRRQRQRKTPKGSILIGTVRADDPSIAIKGSQVTLIGPGKNGPRRKQTTDATGAVEFTGLDPGDYTFTYALPQPHLVAQPHGTQLSIGEGGFDLLTVYAAPTGTLVVVVVDALTGAKVKPPCTLQLTASAQAVAWNGDAEGPQTFAKVAPGRYAFVASPDLTRFEPLLDGQPPAGSAKVPPGGSATVTIKLMPRTWIKFSVWDTHHKRQVGRATVKLQPNAGEAPRSAPTDGVNPLEFGMAKKVTACRAAEVDVEGEEIYEVTGVESA